MEHSTAVVEVDMTFCWIFIAQSTENSRVSPSVRKLTSVKKTSPTKAAHQDTADHEDKKGGWQIGGVCLSQGHCYTSQHALVRDIATPVSMR